MTCRQLVEFLMAYLDERLPKLEQRCFEEHLEECPDCVAYLATYREAVRIGTTVCLDGEESALAEAPRELVQALLSARCRESC